MHEIKNGETRTTGTFERTERGEHIENGEERMDRCFLLPYYDGERERGELRLGHVVDAAVISVVDPPTPIAMIVCHEETAAFCPFACLT